VLELEQENARLAAELEQAKAPKEGTADPTVTIKGAVSTRVDVGELAEEIRKSIGFVLGVGEQPARPAGKKPFATTFSELRNGPQVLEVVPTVVWIGVPRDDDGTAGQTAAPSPRPPKGPIVQTCANPLCEGHLRPDVARMLTGSVALDPARE